MRKRHQFSGCQEFRGITSCRDGDIPGIADIPFFSCGHAGVMPVLVPYLLTPASVWYAGGAGVRRSDKLLAWRLFRHELLPPAFGCDQYFPSLFVRRFGRHQSDLSGVRHISRRLWD